MAKIRITESELKELIRESVKHELLEAGGGGVAYGAGWSNLSPEEKQAAINRYSAWRTLSGNISPEKAQQIYNRKRDRKLRKAEKYNWDANKQIRRGLSVSQNFAAGLEQSANTAKAATNSLASAIANANQQLNTIVASLNEAKKTRKIKLQEIFEEENNGAYTVTTTTGADGTTTTATGRTFTPDQITALVSQLNTNVANIKTKTETLKGEITRLNGIISQQKNNILTLTNQVNQAKQSQAMRVQNNQNAIQRNPANNNLQGPGLTAQARVNPPQTPPLGTQLGA